jgi:putative CocE/NonD family hydrolase
VYSTPPLERDVEVTGPLIVTLWAATSAPDTDFTAKLVDVCEHGCARNLTDGIIRARYRDSRSIPSLVEPGRVYRYTIDLWATSNVFKAGHRIRVEISSSNFPRFDRNPNTGKRVAEDSDLRPVLQTILHNAQYPSHITLPIVPR